MKKASLFSGAFVASLAAIGIASPAMAQDGMFKDVPNDHWAYQALERLGADKIFIGDPDGTFKGKRTLTRYEMAMVVDRLIRLMDERFVKAPLPEFPKAGNNGVTAGQVQDMLGGYAKKSDLDGKADKSALAGLAKQSDIDTIRRMAAEFQTELTTLGVDLDKVKKTLDNHEKRIAAIEDAWKKRVQVSGQFNAYLRSDFNTDGDLDTFFDKDGFRIDDQSAASSARVLHDLDIYIKATPTENTNVDIALNFGNYLPFLGTTTNFDGTGTRGGRGGFTPATILGGNDQIQTIWKAVFSYSKSLPVLGQTGIQVGRVPFKLSPYTFHGFDVDSYFNNSKTDSGEVPIDGLVSNFNLGRFAVKAFAGKNDPIAFVSGLGQGLAIGGGNAWSGGLTRGNVLRAPGSNRGAGVVSQTAGANVAFNIGSIGLGASYLSSGAVGAVAATSTVDVVNTVGGSASFRLLGLNFAGEYAKTDQRTNSTTKRSTLNLAGTDAWEGSAQLGSGSWSLKGGYRYVGPNFAAAGNWARLGTLQNPTDIQGAFGTLNLNLGSKLNVAANGQFYTGTNRGGEGLGISEDDKINNFGLNAKYAISAAQSFGVGYELTEFDGDGFDAKPRESFLTFQYMKALSPMSSFSLGYQIVDFNGKGETGFTGGSAFDRQKGGILTSTFRVRF